MGYNIGANESDWDNLDLIQGLTTDLLPVVSNQEATISPKSAMKALGKTPSKYNGEGQVVGISKWTSRESTSAEVTQWQSEGDYGICLQTRRVRAFDIDVSDPTKAAAIRAFLIEKLGAMPMRYRENSGNCLLACICEAELYSVPSWWMAAWWSSWQRASSSSPTVHTPAVCGTRGTGR